jgi:hypothetical protein
MQQYKVNDKVFKNITEASAYVTTLNKAVTITPYTPPTKASIKFNVARNMLIREMLEWAGEFAQSMAPSTDVNWMYSVEDDSGFSDAGDTWYEDLGNVTFSSNMEWLDAQQDYNSAVDNFDSLLGTYDNYTTVDSLSQMLNSMYHTMSDHSSETDSYIGEVRASVKRMCEGNNNIAHSYDHPTRTTTISFVGNVDAMYKAYMLERNS